jgi:magnesium transporter
MAQPAAAQGFAVIIEGGAAREATLAEARAALEREAVSIWLHAVERTPELDAILSGPRALHPVTLDDIWVDRAVPKFEDFDRYLYVVAHGATAKGRVELDLVLGARWLFTHGADGPAAAARADLLRGSRQLLRGPAFVAHALLDRMADQLFEVMDGLDDEIEGVEGLALNPRPQRSTLKTLLSLRRRLHGLRRMYVHQREVLLRLSRGESELVPQEARPFFRDVHDHFLRLADLVDDQRIALSNALEAHLSMTSIRMNEIVKVLTLISTVMLPLTFIAGVFGMNFMKFQNTRDLDWKYGYPTAIASVVAVAAGLLAWFKRRGWFD